MAAYITLTTMRLTIPDEIILLTTVKTITGDTSTVLFRLPTGFWRGKKSTPWTPQQISDVQNALDTIPALTPQQSRERIVDNYGPLEMALIRVLLDEINVLRTEINVLRTKVSPPLTPALSMRTETQVRNTIRTKAGLSS